MRSVLDTTPTTELPRSTGAPLTRRSVSAARASKRSACASTVITFVLMMSATRTMVAIAVFVVMAPQTAGNAPLLHRVVVPTTGLLMLPV